MTKQQKFTYCVEVDTTVGIHGAKSEKVGAIGRRYEAGVSHCSLLATFRTNIFQCRRIAMVVSFEAGVGQGSGSLMIRLMSVSAYRMKDAGDDFGALAAIGDNER